MKLTTSHTMPTFLENLFYLWVAKRHPWSWFLKSSLLQGQGKCTQTLYMYMALLGSERHHSYVAAKNLNKRVREHACHCAFQMTRFASGSKFPFQYILLNRNFYPDAERVNLNVQWQLRTHLFIKHVRTVHTAWYSESFDLQSEVIGTPI